MAAAKGHLDKAVKILGVTHGKEHSVTARCKSNMLCSQKKVPDDCLHTHELMFVRVCVCVRVRAMDFLCDGYLI
jgi:hypothetical protein